LASQHFDNHRQFVPGFHGALYAALLLTFVGSCVNLTHSMGNHERLYSAALLVVLTGAVIGLAYYVRAFALRAQDRAIRAEEQLRHYVLTGALLDRRLTIRQIVGLRFASDAELPALAARAAQEGLAPDAIKRAVKDWRPDTYRV
jgi:hypothetical protein